MKKIYIAISLFLLMLSQGYGQTIIYSEDFSGGDLAGWVPKTFNTITAGWVFRSQSNSMSVGGNSGDGTTSTKWVISPQISLIGKNNPVLSFEYAVNYGTNGATDFEVLVSSDYDGTNVNTATWHKLELTDILDNNYVFENSGFIDLGIVSGESSVYVAFKAIHDGSGNATRNYRIDDVVVEEYYNGTNLKALSYSEDFETSLADWTVVNTQGTNVWETQTANFTGTYLGFTADVGNVSEDWIVSSPVNLNNFDVAKLTFDSAVNNGSNGADVLELLISTNYEGDVATADWVSLTYTKATSNLTKTGSGDIDLSSYKGKIINFAFKVLTDGGVNADRSFYIDDISLSKDFSQRVTKTLPYSEDFSTGTNPEFETISVTGTTSWKTFNNGTIESFLLNTNPSEASENWLISPRIDLSSSATNQELLFKLAQENGYNAGNTLEIMVSTNYLGDVTTATWTELEYIQPVFNNSDFYSSGRIDVSAYKTNIVNFAIKVNSLGYDNGRDFYIDDFVLENEKEIKQVPYTQDFEVSKGDWTFYQASGSGLWAYSSSDKALVSGASSASSENWALSPKIDLNVADNYELSFNVASEYGDDISNTLALQYSTDYVSGDPRTATWTTLTYDAPSTNDNTKYYSGFTNLSSLKGENTVTIAFKQNYINDPSITTESRNYLIDDFNVSRIVTGNEESFPHEETFSTGDLGKWNNRPSYYQNTISWVYDGSGAASISGSAAVPFEQLNYLISPRILLNANVGENISFDLAQTGVPNTLSGIGLAISLNHTEGGHPNDANWEQINFASPIVNPDGTFYNSGDIDLSAYHGKRVYIAFVVNHKLGDSNVQFKIDNIKLGEQDFHIKANYLEDFSQVTYDEWTISSITNASDDWSRDAFEFAKIENNSSQSSEDWLVSPEIKIGNDFDVLLEFETAYDSGSDIENSLSLWVAEDFDGTNVSGATWSELSFIHPTTGGFTWTESGIINLSAYVDKNIHIAFKSTSSANAGGDRVFAVDKVSFDKRVIDSSTQVFETSVNANLSTPTGSVLSMSSDHYKRGSQSLKWDWLANSYLRLELPTDIDKGLDGNRGGMVLWVYNETAINDELVFEYSSASQVEYNFTYQLNFTGWRSVWVRFDEDMSGPKASDVITKMEIKAPTTGNGTLYFDKLKFGEFGRNSANGYSGASHQLMADYQMPFIFDYANGGDHWLRVYTDSQRSQDIASEATVSASQQTAINTITARLDSELLGGSVNLSTVTAAETSYASLNITESGGVIKGNPLFCIDDPTVLSKSTDYDPAAFGNKTVDNMIFVFARDYKINGNTASKDKAITLVKYLLDQGVAEGSTFGTLGHFGYGFINIPKAIYVLRSELATAGILEEASAMVAWYTSLGNLWAPFPYSGTNSDGIIGKGTPILCSILMLDDNTQGPKKVAYLKGLKRWHDNAYSEAPGTMDFIKKDGTTFHHAMFYPAYAFSSLKEASYLLKYLNNTEFAISAEKHKNVRNAVYNMSLFSNKHWGLGISGRHPLDSQGSGNMQQTFLNMSGAGDPDTPNSTEDPLMAGSYVRQFGTHSSLSTSAESFPTGNWTYNHGALNIHRSKDHVVTIKGYNRHVTSAECYQAENRYGRYLGYGTVQVMNTGGNDTSGFVNEGFDWNRIPGATIIHRPIDELESPFAGSFLERSQETFAGSTTFKGLHGAFGMSLKERARTNMDGTFVAKKSVFTFGDKVICLGSGIANSTSSRNTETVLFQGSLATESTAIYANSASGITGFPVDQTIAGSSDSWLLDAYGTGYYVRSGQAIKYSKKLQSSKNKDTEAFNQGNYSAAWIDHGAAPSNGEYEYAVLIDTDLSGIQNFHSNMQSLGTASYEVLRKDNSVHAIKDVGTDVYAYVVFNPITNITDGRLRQVNKHSIVMIKEVVDTSLELSVANPDLNILNDKDFNDQGGVLNPSRQSAVTIILDGEWEKDPADTATNYTVSSNGTETTVVFNCIDGLPIEAKLVPPAPMSFENDIVKNNIKVYPNPVDNILYIDNDESNTIQLFNVQGEMFYSGVTKQIDMSIYNRGMYLLRVVSENNTTVFKILRK